MITAEENRGTQDMNICILTQMISTALQYKYFYPVFENGTVDLRRRSSQTTVCLQLHMHVNTAANKRSHFIITIIGSFYEILGHGRERVNSNRFDSNRFDVICFWQPLLAMWFTPWHHMVCIPERLKCLFICTLLFKMFNFLIHDIVVTRVNTLWSSPSVKLNTTQWKFIKREEHWLVCLAASW